MAEFGRTQRYDTATIELFLLYILTECHAQKMEPDVHFLLKMYARFPRFHVDLKLDVQNFCDGLNSTACPASINGRQRPYPKRHSCWCNLDQTTTIDDFLS